MSCIPIRYNHADIICIGVIDLLKIIIQKSVFQRLAGYQAFPHFFNVAEQAGQVAVAARAGDQVVVLRTCTEFERKRLNGFVQVFKVKIAQHPDNFMRVAIHQDVPANRGWRRR